MTKQTITFRTESSKKSMLDDLASSLQKDRSAILNQAIDMMLDVYNWQNQHINQGLQEAKNQDFVEEKNWKNAFNRKQK